MRNFRATASANTGGGEDDFEDPVDWDAIEENENTMAGLKSKDLAEREAQRLTQLRWASTASDPQRATLYNPAYRRQSETLPTREACALAVADGPTDQFDLEYAEFWLRQVEKLLVEVGRERSARKPFGIGASSTGAKS